MKGTVAQLAGVLASQLQSQGFPEPQTLSLLVHTYNLITQEVEAGGQKFNSILG